MNLSNKNRWTVKIDMASIPLLILCMVVYLVADGSRYYSFLLYAVSALTALSVIYTVYRNNYRVVLTVENILVILYALYGLASREWAMDASKVDEMIKSVLAMSVMCMVITNGLFFKKNTELLVKYMLYAGVALVIVCLVDVGIYGLINILKSGSRLGSTTRYITLNANTLGKYCAISAVISLYYYFRKKRILFILMVVIFSLFCAATISRTSMLLLVISLIFLLYFEMNYSKGTSALRTIKYFLLFAVGCLILYLVFQLPLFSSIVDRIAGATSILTGSGKADASADIRNKMVHLGWEQFQNTPIFGIGFNNGKVINAKYLNFPAYLHNNFIEVLVNGGIVGFAIYYLLFAILVVKHLRRMHEREPLTYLSFSILIAMIIQGIGGVQCYDKYAMIILYSLWISVANGFCSEGEKKRVTQGWTTSEMIRRQKLTMNEAKK